MLSQKLPDGVGVGVTPKEVILKSTSSQATLGDGVGSGSQSQSKYAVKSNVSQLTGLGVGVGHGPLVKLFADISGQTEIQGLVPDNKQDPPKLELKHQLLPV